MNKRVLNLLWIVCSFSLFSQVCWADKDVTSYILNPSFETNGTDGWTVTDLSSQTNSDFKPKGGKVYLEKWTSKGKSVGSASLSQILSYLPAGNYRLTVAAQNIQQGSSDAQTGATIYAGTQSTTVTAAQDYTVDFSGVSSVIIGFKAVNASGNWICVDNFRLTFLSANFELLSTAVANAKETISLSEKSSKAGIQPSVKAALDTAIAKAEAATQATAAEELTNIAFELSEAHRKAAENMDQLVELRTLKNNARYYASGSRDMAEIYRVAVEAVYNDAVAVLNFEKEVELLPLIEQLEVAYNNAVASYEAKKGLKSDISKSTKLLSDDKEGVEALTEAINAAIAVRDRSDATPEEMIAAQTALQESTLLFNLQNPSGNPITVKTLKVVQGATEIFGRASFSGPSAIEKGFCYSEDPEPTIFDNRTTFSYSNNGDIYAMQELKPATVYYVRAYAITSGYQLSYGDVVKTVTRPLGNVSYSYDNAGDAATNKRINDACKEAVWMWNNIAGIQGFRLDAHYVPGAGASGGTADCSYGGYMRISQNVPYQKTGTVLHEGSHGLGVINYTEWVDETYRTNGDRGDWLGPRVDRVIQFLENSSSAKLHGDNIHMWPYGINGANEDTGSPILYRGNALIVGALSEDAIETPNQSFKRPAYSLEYADDARYYIKSEDANRGLGTSYLCQQGSKVTFRTLTADEAFSNDSCSWYIHFDPKTCYYTFENVSTGKYLSISGSNLGIAAAKTNAVFQLMGSRNQTSFENYTFAALSYWVIAPSNYRAVQATTTGATTVDFSHQDAATTQRWLFLTEAEVTRFAEHRGEVVGIHDYVAEEQSQTLQVIGGRGVLRITAFNEGQEVNIVSMDGRLVQQVYVQSGATAEIRLPRGIYMTGDQKVLVR